MLCCESKTVEGLRNKEDFNGRIKRGRTYA